MIVALCTQVVNAQTWTFRNGFGQSGATNSLPDVGRAICTDASGNVYITGKISDDLTGNTVSFGGTALVSAGDDDGFVAKFNSSGVHQWSIRFGGTSFTDIGYGIATDGTSVYVAGAVNGAMTVGTSPTSYPVAGAGIDGVIMKLDAATGGVTWVTRFGGGNSDEAQSIAVDPSGNVYVSGIFRTRTTNPTATFGGFSRTVQGNAASYTSDLFVAQLNSSGTFQWVSTGGISGSNDNINGSGVCYVPGLSEVVATGSFRAALSGSTTATYSTTTPASTVTLTNSGAVVNEDFCLLELSASTGAFITGSSAGSSDGNEYGLGITYDANTSNVFFVGGFSSASVTFPGLAAITNGASTRDNILYGRYNPSTDAYIWVKDADNSASASAADVGRAINSNNAGRVFIAGNFRNTVTFPSGLSLTASGAQADIFVAGINVTTGNADYVTQGTGTSSTADDIGYGVAGDGNGNVWITGQYASNLTLSPLSALASNNNKEDVLLAKYLDRPTITTPPAAASACTGLPVTFSVVASGTGLGYSWQEATNAGFTTGLVTLSNTGVYSGTNTATLTISDNSALAGRFYRVIVSNSAGSVTSSGAQLTVNSPTLSGANTVTQNVGTNNNLYYASGCGLVGKIVPSGGSPVTGSVTTQVWIEGAVPTYASQPFVQRHYQVTPAVSPSTSTAAVTLYFTQAEFDNFNAAPGSTLNLPTGPGDAGGKANLRIGKYMGSSNNGSGLPASYTSSATVIDPPDAQIVWNATFSRWEVTFDVVGFSGFIVQTYLFVLPVKLDFFTAQLVNNDVQLKWQTSGESEIDHFDVERSVDGQNYTSIGKRAALNANTIASYELKDAAVSALNKGSVFYRLKTTSQSGKEEYSRIVIVYIDKKGSLITGVLPNPFVHELNLGINAPRNGQMKLTIADMAGKVVLNQQVTITKGFSTQTIRNADRLNTGVYILTVNFEGQTATYKIEKQ